MANIERNRKKKSIRQQAEDQLAQNPPESQKISSPDPAVLIHELQVHQVELEMQNEDLRQSQEKLAKARDKYQDFFDSVPVGYFILNTQNIILDVNQTAAQMFSTTKGGLYHKRFSTLIESRFQKTFYSEAVKALKEYQPQECDLVMIRQDGSQLFSHLHIVPIRDDTGENIQLRISVADITKRREAEEALKESEERFSKAFHANHSGIAILMPSGPIIDVNKAFERITGYAKDETIGRSSTDLGLVTTDYRTKLYEEIRHKGKLADFEVKIQTKSGEYRTVLQTIENIQVKGQEYILSMFSDITDRKKAEEALRQSEEKYRNLFENMTEAFILGEPILDNKGQSHDVRFLEVNKAWEKWVKISRRKAVGKTYRELISQPLPELIEKYSKVALTGHSERYEIYSPYTHTWVNGYIYSPMKGKFAAIFTDITERKKLEEKITENNLELALKVKERTLELALSEEKYRLLVENATEAVVVFQDNREKFFNRRAIELSGYSSEELASIPIPEFIHPDDRELVMTRYFSRIQGKGIPSSYEFRMIHKNGSTVWVEINAVLITWEGKPAILALMNDITQRKQMEQSLKEYAQRITQVQEEERKRIAYELHDDTAQYLSILKMQIGALASSEELQNPKVKEKLRFLEKDADRAFNDVRRYSHELRPVVLEHQGLMAALEQLSEDFNNLGQLAVEVQVEGIEPKLSEEVKLGFFRIAQEALNNSRKHAKANQVVIAIRFNHKNLRMIVSDDGEGFDTKQALKIRGDKGNLGLLSMKERAGLINADLKIESAPGKGTKVILQAEI